MDAVDKIDLFMKGMTFDQIDAIEKWQKKNPRLSKFLKGLR